MICSVNAPVTPTAGRWTGGRSVYLKDPDGIRVELVQHRPATAGPTGVPVPGESVVEPIGIEPTTSALRTRRSPS